MILGRKSIVVSSLMVMLPFLGLYAQDDIGDIDAVLGKEVSANPIRTVVPFLSIAPDSRAGAMGDAGIATSADANSMHWNPAKYAFIEGDGGLSVSFTPWLANLVDDIYLAYLSGYYRTNEREVWAGSLRYFSLGNIQFTNDFGQNVGQHSPNEFALDVAYSRKLSKTFSGGLAFRYIRSDLTGGGYVGNTAATVGQSFAADVSVYYFNDKINYGANKGSLAFGVNVKNIGNQVSYTEGESDFIPTNLGIGIAPTLEVDEFNSITLAFDVNKLLVPTPPELDTNDNIAYGMDPDVAVATGMFQSFYDAPGIAQPDGSRSVLQEELQEIMYSIGIEYWYNKQFAVRAGYFYEHERKGNRKYFTVGMGLKMNVIGVDFSYLIPDTKGNNGNHPLANTIRFSLLFDLSDPGSI